MKKSITFGIFLSVILFLGTAGSTILGQTLKLDGSSSQITVDGTSNVHDWTIEAEKLTGSLVISGEEMETLSLSVPAEGLKSGKSGMDKNTYKALNTNKNKNITFKLTDDVNLNSSSAKLKGTLTIAGKSKNVTIDAKTKKNGNTVSLTGEKKITMKDFGVEPPTAMFGAIKTGEDVVVKFNLLFK